jgi:hypothetical protein
VVMAMHFILASGFSYGLIRSLPYV